MPLEFINRKGNRYYIKSKLTKKGNTTYFMTKKEDEHCLYHLPEGYEVFEKPDSGLMLIRKKKEHHYKSDEIELVERELKKNETIEDFKLDIIGDTIKIYVAEKGEIDSFSEFFGRSFFSEEKVREFRKNFVRFEETMRIVKRTPGKSEEYEFQRYCYRGSVDTWISIGKGKDLHKLAKSNIYHLGKESYYDLM